MSLEPTFKSMVEQTFGDANSSQVLKWLTDESICTAEEFGLLAADEKEVEGSILAPAKTGGVQTDPLRIKIAFEKLWKLCRSEEAGTKQMTDTAESEEGLNDRIRKSCMPCGLRNTASPWHLGGV